jgi:hypothetical protein
LGLIELISNDELAFELGPNERGVGRSRPPPRIRLIRRTEGCLSQCNMVSSSATLISKVMHGCSAQRRDDWLCGSDDAKRLVIGEGK